MKRVFKALALTMVLTLSSFPAFADLDRKYHVSFENKWLPDKALLSYVRLVNPELLPIKFDDRLIESMSENPISEYYSVRTGPVKVTLGTQETTFNFIANKVYTILSFPQQGGIVIQEENQSFVDATDVKDYEEKVRIRLYDLSMFSDYFLKTWEGQIVFSSGQTYMSTKVPALFIKDIIAKPGRRLTLNVRSMKVADFPDLTLEAGQTYTIIIAGTIQHPQLYLANTPSLFEKGILQWERKSY